MMRAALVLLALVAFVLACTAGCSDDRRNTDFGGDSDSDTDSDSDGDGPTGPIPQDCSDCVGVGTTMENLLCAFDICDPNLIADDPEILTPTGADPTGATEAVAHFGATSNGLAPQLNDSYTLVASGPANGTEHSVWIDPGTGGMQDEFCPQEDYSIYDVVEWKLTLQAPDEAHGFGFKYVFFSEEYDDYISTVFNDKFYVVIEAGSTNSGERSVINFTNCREPDVYYDFICEGGMVGCEEGQKYCYIAINSAFSDCCWYNGCPDGYSWDVGTDISGTGYECAADQMSDSSAWGSSTGWLQTTWPINPGEVFSLTFHVHDTSDGIFDSEVILDSFQFMYDSTVPETTQVE